MPTATSFTDPGVEPVPEIDSPLAAIRHVAGTIASRRILDVGCGEGRLVHQMVEAGAVVSGIDPLEPAITRARSAIAGARFFVGGAENLPFENASFDVVVMVNALHHVPLALMARALGEAVRVVAPQGMLIVLEPLATGSMFAAVRPIDDETLVRQAAQDALRQAMTDRLFVPHASFTYVRREVFGDAAQVIARIVAVDPDRQKVVDAQRRLILDTIETAAQRLDGGRLALDQPTKVDAFRR